MDAINREDMLELTRRMTLKRNCFGRIAGAYFDGEGYVDGTFNTHFRNLTVAERTKNLAVAKAIPFSETNVNLKEYVFSKEQERQGSAWRILMGMRDSELKNDALLDLFYEHIGEHYHTKNPYAVYFFHGSYDVPLKASDKQNLWESEEVYRFIICAFCPVQGDYEAGSPECGFLFPAFKERSSDIHRINIFHADAKNPHVELWENILAGASL